MTTRINPHRLAQANLKREPATIKRIVLSTAQIAAEAHPAKWLRTPSKPKSRVLVIAHSDRGALDDHALQAIAAAAILADAETAVLALILGELNDDLSTAGADEVMILPALDFQIFQPDIELASVLAVIESLQPSRIFMPDNLIGDGDLGRRLAALKKLSVATHVLEIDAQHVASAQSGGCVLAQSNLPEVILLAPNAVDAELPFTAKAARIDVPTINHAAGSYQAHYQDQYQDLGLQTSAAEDIALEEADFIVSAGNGVQNLATLASLASSLNAASTHSSV